MRNRTIYDVLDKTMEDYSYSIKKTGNKVEIKGSVTVPRVEIEVTHEKVFYYTPEERDALADMGINNNLVLSKVVASFKEELKDKVASVIKEHKEELIDDEVMIKRLQSQIRELQGMLGETETELKKAREEITRLELEKVTTQPYPWGNPTPWSTGTTPWSPGITWETQIGDPPGWLDHSTTCDSPGEYIYNDSSVTTQDGLERNGGTVNYTLDVCTKASQQPQEIRYRKFKSKKKNGGEF